MTRAARLAGLVLSFTLLIPAAVPAEEIEIKTALHVHSIISSGGRSLRDIAVQAREEGIDAVIMTDLLAENFEYGAGPLRWPKVRVSRHSILKYGAEKYFSELDTVDREFPDVLMIDGAAATPFYYWTGNVFPGPLVLNSRGKDLLAVGLGAAGNYAALPVMGSGRSDFNPYNGDQYAAPYQQFIEAVNAMGGLAIWSHPAAKEHETFDLQFMGRKVVLDTPDYGADMLATDGYTAFGVYAVELAQIDNPDVQSHASPGGTWDRLLDEYCTGRRQAPVWAVGEVDYNGMQGGITGLSGILNMIKVREKSRGEVLTAIRDGRLYLITPARDGRRLVLAEFSVSAAAGSPLVRAVLKDSAGGGGPVRVLLIRNGQVLKQWDTQLPASLDYQEVSAPAETSLHYYRLIAVTPGGANLLSNPVFLRRPSR